MVICRHAKLLRLPACRLVFKDAAETSVDRRIVVALASTVARYAKKRKERKVTSDATSSNLTETRAFALLLPWEGQGRDLQRRRSCVPKASTVARQRKSTRIILVFLGFGARKSRKTPLFAFMSESRIKK